ncbi:hypothetical protein BJY04DRAFT_175405 [Aspergillus karnatakaensis]|uniref:uncharacterized protein n=1 Tax=Aspergillus karnatakaensis TaxID=1810916 RepID=UPI003CCD8F5D
MKYPILSLAGVLIRSALARDCILPEPTTTIYSHEGLGVLQECTSITGNLVVDPSFTTHFVLENLTILNGSITVADIYYTMVAIRLPNLVSAGALILHEIIDVELPRLDHIGDLLLDSFLPNNLDLGALTDANNIWIYGGWASVNLNNLTTVHKELAFKFAKTRHTLGRMPPWLVVDLPALKTTAQFTVEGRIWRVSAPELEVAGDMGMHDLNYTTGIRFNINNPIELEFPKLHSIGRQTQVFGMVSRISLPALGETDSGLHFNTDSALEIYSTIQTARWVWLWGQIKRFAISLFHSARSSEQSLMIPPASNSPIWSVSAMSALQRR